MKMLFKKDVLNFIDCLDFFNSEKLLSNKLNLYNFFMDFSEAAFKKPYIKFENFLTIIDKLS